MRLPHLAGANSTRSFSTIWLPLPRSIFPAKNSLTGGVKSAPAKSTSPGITVIAGGDLDWSDLDVRIILCPRVFKICGRRYDPNHDFGFAESHAPAIKNAVIRIEETIGM